ncbi:MAG: TIGR00153 family protein [Nitrospira sp.]|nr:TIGR00153 family protein [Nitrospira sp.]
MLKKVFGGNIEQKVIDSIKKHMQILYSASECFKKGLQEWDKDQMHCVADLEREGDSVRREIISMIYEGAFLPYLRTNICRFVEIVDEAFDVLKDTAYEFENLEPMDEDIREDCIQIADINQQMCDMLIIAFDALFNKGDLREKTLAIRIYEKKVDDMKFDLIGKLRNKEVKNFWEGRTLSDSISYLTHISDVIEDASDYLHIINLSMR